MRISNHILLLVIVCTVGGLALAAGLYHAHDKLSQRIERQNAFALTEHDTTRLEENFSQWLVWCDLIFGNGNTYLVEGALEHGNALHEEIQNIHNGPGNKTRQQELGVLNVFVKNNQANLTKSSWSKTKRLPTIWTEAFSKSTKNRSPPLIRYRPSKKAFKRTPSSTAPTCTRRVLKQEHSLWSCVLRTLAWSLWHGATPRS